MEVKLPNLFNSLSRMPYGIQAAPDYIAPRAPTAYDQRPADDESRAGVFFMDTYHVRGRPLYKRKALSFHEGMPGHHLQLAPQQGLASLTDFRHFVDFTAFKEDAVCMPRALAWKSAFTQIHTLTCE